jgi:CubicO group peptidase (beta-lactamase class C family)
MLTALSACTTHLGMDIGDEDLELRDVIGAARSRWGLPAIAVLVARGCETLSQAASGVRMVGDAQEVGVGVPWHIGSCTKAMAATLTAIFIERGHASWESRLGDIFPERAGQMHRDAAGIERQRAQVLRPRLPARPRREPRSVCEVRT